MSDYDTYGKLAIDSVWLSESGVRYHKNDDDSMTVTLKATPTEAGNVDVQLPTTAGTLMKTDDDLDSRNLVNGTLLASVAPTDSDAFLIYDASDSNDPKRVSGSSLKTYIGASGLPTGNTEANVLVADASGDFQSVALSGDATIAASGALTLGAGVVETSMLADDSVDGDKIAAGAVDGTHLAVGSVSHPNKFAANVVNTAAIGAGQVTSSELGPDAVTEAKIADDAVTNAKLAGSVAQDKLADGFSTAGTWAASKLCSVDANLDATGGRHLTLSGDVDLGSTGAVYLGDKSTNGSWRMVRSGDDIVWERRESDSWVQKGSFVA